MNQPQTIIRKSPRWVKILLTLSLAFNLLIISAIGSKIYFAPESMGKINNARLARPGALQTAGFHLMQMASKQRKLELARLVRVNRRKLRHYYQNIANSRLALAKTLNTRPFNIEAMQKALQAVHSAETEAHNQISNFTATFLSSLTPQEREDYAKLLTEPPRQRWKLHWNRMRRNMGG